MAGIPETLTKWIDQKKGQTHRHIINYADLTQYLKDKIDELDLTVRELMEMEIIEERSNGLMDFVTNYRKLNSVPGPRIVSLSVSVRTHLSHHLLRMSIV